MSVEGGRVSLPIVGVISLAIIDSSVDFPQPLGPINEINSPS